MTNIIIILNDTGSDISEQLKCVHVRERARARIRLTIRDNVLVLAWNVHVLYQYLLKT